MPCRRGDQRAAGGCGLRSPCTSLRDDIEAHLALAQQKRHAAAADTRVYYSVVQEAGCT
jgi:hypothetical protein